MAIVRQNQKYYEDFCVYLKQHGYQNIYVFINEPSDAKATKVIGNYLARRSGVQLLDGLARPYKDATAKWYFLAWILRDAPAQRLRPLLTSVQGESLDEKRANLLNQLRKFVGPLFPQAESWSWPALSEVMLARLEGSRRALKGTRFEELVRGAFRTVFERRSVRLEIGDGEKRIKEETFDVQIIGKKRTILVPVKTRETMGGGHANLFTRDIFKAISVAHENGYECVPVIIAESWGGDLKSLRCEHWIYLRANPNQTEAIGPMLENEVEKLIPFFKRFA
ncbi:MAG: hypothetical protein ABSH38_04990 [Verrucomicrobiota bacterium]